MQDIEEKDIEEILRTSKVLLIGDFMLDVYTIGTVLRLSPEAPVPLLSVSRETSLPGGGGNVILNLLSLGMEVEAVGRVGKDHAGSAFLQLMSESGANIEAIFVDEEFKTPVKKRMIADHQQLLRVDYEKVSLLSSDLEVKIKDHLIHAMKKVSVIAISDYGKGFFTPSLLQYTIGLAREFKIPIIIDPKGTDFTKYRGSTLIKPNFSEAVRASGLSADASLKDIALRILYMTQADVLMITRGKEGISIFWQNDKEAHFPAVVHTMRDVTGAGDTVLAVITASMANDIDLEKGAQLANIAAGIAIEHLGCTSITREQIKKRFEKRQDLKNDYHVSAL